MKTWRRHCPNGREGKPGVRQNPWVSPRSRGSTRPRPEPPSACVGDQEAGLAHELVGALRDHHDGELVVDDLATGQAFLGGVVPIELEHHRPRIGLVGRLHGLQRLMLGFLHIRAKFVVIGCHLARCSFQRADERRNCTPAGCARLHNVCGITERGPAPRSRYGAGPREVFRGRAPGSTLGRVGERDGASAAGDEPPSMPPYLPALQRSAPLRLLTNRSAVDRSGASLLIPIVAGRYHRVECTLRTLLRAMQLSATGRRPSTRLCTHTVVQALPGRSGRTGYPLARAKRVSVTHRLLLIDGKKRRAYLAA